MSLVINDLSVNYGAIRAVKGLSVTIASGELTAVIGSNGAGKTTLLRSLSGLIPASSGTVTWNGESILRVAPEELVRRGIVHVSEGKAVIPELTVSENLQVGGIWRKDRADVKTATEEVLELFPRLRERLTQRAETLSGGERQMLAIGRALVARPQLLLLDEPSLGLAPIIIEQIFSAIKSLLMTKGVTVVLVEQNAMGALSIADQGIIIDLGTLVASGPAKELINDPVLRSSYLGY